MENCDLGRVNRRGQYNRAFHPGSLWSNIYVDVGDSPSATNPLADPQIAAESGFGDELPVRSVWTRSSAAIGMIVFPRPLPHTMHPTMANDRASIALSPRDHLVDQI
jgi:hypothetical protein